MLLGCELGPLEARVYPLKVLDDLSVEPGNVQVELITSVPLAGAIDRARLNGRALPLEQLGTRGDVRQARVRFRPERSGSRVVFTVREGSDMYRELDAAPAGASNTGLRILRSRASAAGLQLRGGTSCEGRHRPNTAHWPLAAVRSSLILTT